MGLFKRRQPINVYTLIQPAVLRQSEAMEANHREAKRLLSTITPQNGEAVNERLRTLTEESAKCLGSILGMQEAAELIDAELK